VYNLINTTSTPWSEIITYLLEPINLGPDIKVVPFSHWIEQLQKADAKGDETGTNPSLRLLGYFSRTEGRDGVGFETSAMSEAVGFCGDGGSVRGGFGKVGRKGLGRMIAAWRESGYLN